MQTLIKTSTFLLSVFLLTGCFGFNTPEAKVEEFLKTGSYQLLSQQTQAQVSEVEFTALYRPKLKLYLPEDDKLSPIEKILKSLVLIEYVASPRDKGTKVLAKALYPKALDEMEWFSSGLETKLAFQPLIERLIVLYRFEMIQPGEVDFTESVETFYLDDTGIILDIDALREQRKTEKHLAIINAKITEMTPDVALWRMRSENPKNYQRFTDLMTIGEKFEAQQSEIESLAEQARALDKDYQHLALTSWRATLANIKQLQTLLAHVKQQVVLSEVSLVATQNGDINLQAWVSYKGDERFSADCRLIVKDSNNAVLLDEIVPQFLFNIANHTERSLLQRVSLTTIPENVSLSVEIVAVYPEYLN